MKGTTFALATVSVLSLGCGHRLMEPSVEGPSAADRVRARARAAALLGLEADEGAEVRFGDLMTSRTAAFDYVYVARTEQPVQRREPGDFVVYRIAAKHLPSPVMVTQRVVERHGARLIIDQTIDDGYEPIELRLRVDDEPYGSNTIRSVARLEQGVQLPYGSAAYRDLMDALAPPVDQQLGRLGGGRTSVHVGESIVPCESTSYRVTVDGRQASMTVLQSLSFAWGDIGGVLRDGKGRELYSAQIVDLGETPMHTAAGMIAASSEQDDYDEWDELE